MCMTVRDIYHPYITGQKDFMSLMVISHLAEVYYMTSAFIVDALITKLIFSLPYLLKDHNQSHYVNVS